MNKNQQKQQYICMIRYNCTSGLSSLSRSDAIESSIIASTVRSTECSTQ